MTLEELDDGLRKLGLNLDSKEGIAVRNRIVSDYGRSSIAGAELRCKHCEMNGVKQRIGCNWCDIKNISNNPLEAGMSIINRPNDISLFPFIVEFAIPVYIELTGDKDIMKKMGDVFRKSWKKAHPNEISRY